MSDAPARVWDLVGKGRIAPGYDADLVLVDMNRSATVRDEQQQTKCGWSPWHGTTLQGWPVRTWVRGQLVFREGQFDESRRGREAVYDHSRGGYWATSGVASRGAR
jgi:dihydroorotase